MLLASSVGHLSYDQILIFKEAIIIESRQVGWTILWSAGNISDRAHVQN